MTTFNNQDGLVVDVGRGELTYTRETSSTATYIDITPNHNTGATTIMAKLTHDARARHSAPGHNAPPARTAIYRLIRELYSLLVEMDIAEANKAAKQHQRALDAEHGLSLTPLSGALSLPTSGGAR